MELAGGQAEAVPRRRNHARTVTGVSPKAFREGSPLGQAAESGTDHGRYAALAGLGCLLTRTGSVWDNSQNNLSLVRPMSKAQAGFMGASVMRLPKAGGSRE